MTKVTCGRCLGYRVTKPTSHISVYQGQRFVVTERPPICDQCSKITVTGVRMDKDTEEQKPQNCIIEARKKSNGEVWLVITQGNVTGYESVKATKTSVKTICSEGWVACMGTKNRWDRLLIPAAEMDTACKKLLLK